MAEDGHDDTVIRPRPDGATRDAPDAHARFRRPTVDDLEADTVVPSRTPASGSRAEASRTPASGSRAEASRAEGSLAAASPTADAWDAGRTATLSASPPGPVAGIGTYRFVVNNGEPVRLDVPAILGRSPRAPRIAGAVVPRLVPVASPGQEVSGSHLEVAQQGGAVVVTDLRTTNGTDVVVPSGERVRLRPGESFVAVPGSLVEIGDGNVIEILGVERLVSPLDPVEHLPGLAGLTEIGGRTP